MENVSSKSYYLENPSVLPNLDPEERLKLGWYNLSLCRQCFNVFGQTVEFVQRDGRTIENYNFQQCKCHDEQDLADGEIVPIWPGYDFNRAVEFCHCCSKELINTGSKFSLLYCLDCTNLVLDYNQKTWDKQLPLSRHPSLNAINLSRPISQNGVEVYQAKVKAFNEKVSLVYEWQHLCLFENLHDLGFDFKYKINMADYNERVNDLKHDKEYYLNRMVHYLLYRY